jgi:release factor glutamine methyltransferase
VTSGTSGTSGPVTSLRDAVRAAARVLADAGVDSAEFDAVALAAHVLRISTAEVHKLMITGSPIPEGLDHLLDDVVAERARRVPLQHLTGKAGFRRLVLSVGPGVFVPRFETELTAGLAIAFLSEPEPGKPRERADQTSPNLGTLLNPLGKPRERADQAGANLGTVPNPLGKPRERADQAGANLGTVPNTVSSFGSPHPARSLGLPVVVDLCSGSGAIALAIKDEVPAAEVHGVELSDLAHAWAIRNRDDLGLDVDLRLGDARVAFPDLEASVDVVVSNPPYIPVGAVPNDPEVRDHDPEVALFGGSSDGLRIPTEVAARAAVLLRPGGLLVMEHADVQGDSLPAALRATGSWRELQDHMDLNGRPRALTAIRAR